MRLVADPVGRSSAHRHLEGCGACRRRLAQLQREQAALLTVGATPVAKTLALPPSSDDAAVDGEFEIETRLPTRIGRFPVRSWLSSGGQADLFLGTHPTLGADIVVKIAKHGGNEPDDALSVEHEARALASLQHPGLPRVLDADLHEGRPYLVMELLPGERLSAFLTRRPPTVGEIISRMLQLTDAVLAAHDRGFLHLDLKPDNVLVDGRGNAKLIDFGAAGLQLDRSETPKVPVVFGTPEYMSPEQRSGDPGLWSRRVDVYGLGGVLYFQLFGEAPHANGRPRPTFRPAAKPVWEPNRQSASDDVPQAQVRDDSPHFRLIAICRQALCHSEFGRQACVKCLADELRAVKQSTNLSTRSLAAMCVVLVGVMLGLTSWAISGADKPALTTPAALPPGQLRAQLLTDRGAIPLQQGAPLRTGDQLALFIDSPQPQPTELFLVVSPQIVVPCLPLAEVRDQGGQMRFPGGSDGWPIGSLDRCGLLISIHRPPSATSSYDRLRDVLRSCVVELSHEINCAELRASGPDPDARRRLGSLTSLWKEQTAAEHLQQLQVALDAEFSSYHAIVFRFDAAAGKRDASPRLTW
jgi:serine/threonine protein kinase